jgi:NAD(P)-dependent dehydrogenase (short-subunit alcohol dehydrogenase family)
LDGLICNAGVGGAGPLEFAALDELTNPIDTNVYGSIVCANLLSLPLVSTYPAAKYALELLTRQLRLEVAPFGVRVILVDPGRIKSRMTLSAEEQNEQARTKLPPEAFDLYGDMLASLDRMVANVPGSGKEPELVAEAYLKALTDPSPKDFYTVGTDAKVMRIVAGLSPQWLLDKLSARIISRAGA